jgi:arginase
VRDVTIIEAPSVLGLRPTGVEELPEALLGAGLAGGLGAVRAGRVEPPAYDPERDPDAGVLNPDGIAGYSVALADAVGGALDDGRFPVVLGGDCSVLLGNLLALRRRDRHGLLFLDGHTDFYQPSAEPAGEVASMELALATGRGPRVLADLEGRGPLVRDEDVVALGFRDAGESATYGMQPLPSALHAMELDTVRALGAAESAQRAVGLLTGDGASAGYWIHLDVDVLDDAVMPAVDYRLPGGLSWQELETVLRTALSGDGAVGLDVAIFNPRLDPDGSIARRLTECLLGSFDGQGLAPSGAGIWQKLETGRVTECLVRSFAGQDCAGPSRVVSVPVVVHRHPYPPPHQPILDERLDAGPLATGQAAADARHVDGRAQLGGLAREGAEGRVDRLVADGGALAAGPDAALADHVGHPHIRLDLHEPHRAQPEVVRRAASVPGPVRLLRLGPAARYRHDEALAPAPNVVADMGDDLDALHRRDGGVTPDIPDPRHDATVDAATDNDPGLLLREL